MVTSEPATVERTLERASAGPVLDWAGDAFYTLDRDGRFTYVNRHVERMVGKRRRDMIGRSVFELFPQAVGGIGHEARLRAVRENRPVSYEARSPVTGRWVQATVYPDETGAAVHVRDITARKRADEALQPGENRFRTALKNAPIIVSAVDSDLRYTWMYPQCAVLRLADLLGKRLDEVLPTDEAARLIDVKRQVLATGEGTRREMPFEIGGRRLVYDVTLEPLRDPAGAVVGVTSAALDITGRRRAERALGESEARFRQFAEAVPAMAWITDESGRVTHVNGRWCAYTGLSLEETLGMGWTGAVHPEDREPVLQLREEARRLGSAFEAELRYRSREGAYRWHLARTEPMRDKAGRLTGWFGIGAEIEGLKRADERQRLLTAELSHRVRNTLAVVQAIASQTLRRAGSLEDFAASFNGRLRALASAHSLLTRSDWRSARLEAVIRHALKALGTGGQVLTLSGPDLALAPKQALALALVFHELATNAAKYGALSAPSGRVEIGWGLNDSEAGPRLRIEWIERGGPGAQEPGPKGFGTALIERMVKHDLGGGARLVFGQEGLSCEIALPYGGGPAASG